MYINFIYNSTMHEEESLASNLWNQNLQQQCGIHTANSLSISLQLSWISKYGQKHGPPMPNIAFLFYLLSTSRGRNLHFMDRH
jgi:hypothetical protein